MKCHVVCRLVEYAPVQGVYPEDIAEKSVMSSWSALLGQSSAYKLFSI